MDPLTGQERGQLALCEQVIERGKRSWIDMGGALRAIRDARLYRMTYGTFEEYCEQRWELSRRHCYRLIDAATAAENVTNWTQTKPRSEGQLRPLAGVPAEQQREVWAVAEAIAPRGAQGQPKITASIVAAARGKILPLRRSAPVTLRPGAPEESALAMLAAWEPRDLVKFYGELGYALHQRGMLTNWSDAILDMLKSKAAR